MSCTETPSRSKLNSPPIHSTLGPFWPFFQLKSKPRAAQNSSTTVKSRSCGCDSHTVRTQNVCSARVIKMRCNVRESDVLCNVLSLGSMVNKNLTLTEICLRSQERDKLKTCTASYAARNKNRLATSRRLRNSQSTFLSHTSTQGNSAFNIDLFFTRDISVTKRSLFLTNRTCCVLPDAENFLSMYSSQ